MAIDWIKCDYPLPDERAQDIVFETNNLAGLCGSYIISQDGRLLVYRFDYIYKKVVEVNLLWHRTVHIYSDFCIDGNTRFSYDVKFAKGLVKEIVIPKHLQKDKA